MVELHFGEGNLGVISNCRHIGFRLNPEYRQIEFDEQVKSGCVDREYEELKIKYDLAGIVFNSYKYGEGWVGVGKADKNLLHRYNVLCKAGIKNKEILKFGEVCLYDVNLVNINRLEIECLVDSAIILNHCECDIATAMFSWLSPITHSNITINRANNIELSSIENSTVTFNDVHQLMLEDIINSRIILNCNVEEHTIKMWESFLALVD